MTVDEGAAKGFLERWSERKLAAGDGPQTGEAPEQAADGYEVAAEPERVCELTDANMPPLETLDEGSDYSGFLSPGVSSELRCKALRRLFQGARFNVADGLDDYNDDFTSFAPLGDIVTADMRHRIEEAAGALLADGAADEADCSTESASGVLADDPEASSQALSSAAFGERDEQTGSEGA